MRIVVGVEERKCGWSSRDGGLCPGAGDESFNIRSGNPFQSRCKSILCEEEPCFVKRVSSLIPDRQSCEKPERIL